MPRHDSRTTSTSASSADSILPAHNLPLADQHHTDTLTSKTPNSNAPGSGFGHESLSTSTIPVPDIEVSSPKGTTLTSPASSPTLTPTLHRLRNFSFVPLLPIEEPLFLPTAVVEPPPPPPAPRRKINMTFVPLCEVKDESLTPPEPPQTFAQAVHALNPPTSVRSTSPEVHTPLETVPESPGEEIEEPSVIPLNSIVTRQGRIALSLTDPGAASTPALSSASDTETETETDTDADTFTDTDAESDFAPSTSTATSSVPSPPCEIDASEYFVAEDDCRITSGEISEVSRRKVEVHQEVKGYFSAVVPLSRPGETPPLSVLYPTEGAQVPVPALKKLQALPSPALVPPSPFSLYPPTLGNASGLGVSGAALSVPTTRMATAMPATTKRAFMAPRKPQQSSGLGLGVRLACDDDDDSAEYYDDSAWMDLESSKRREKLSASLSRRRV